MSAFSSWARHLTNAVAAVSDQQLKYQQALEILAAGLGHGTYASYTGSDARLCGVATTAVPDPERMAQRASEIGCLLAETTWRQILRACKGRQLGQLALETQEDLAAFPSFHLLLLDQTEVLWPRRLGQGAPHTPLEQAHGQWRWTVQAFRRSGGFDLATRRYTERLSQPVHVTVAYPRLGRRLLGAPKVVDVQDTGHPIPTEHEEPPVVLDPGALARLANDLVQARFSRSGSDLLHGSPRGLKRGDAAAAVAAESDFQRID